MCGVNSRAAAGGTEHRSVSEQNSCGLRLLNKAARRREKPARLKELGQRGVE